MNIALQATHLGYHKLNYTDNINPARWLAEALRASEVCKDEIDYNIERINTIASALWDADYALPKWNFSLGNIPLYPQFEDKEELLKYYLVLSSVNYEYFHLGQADKHGEVLRFQDGQLSGAELATSRITQYWKDLSKPQFLRDLTLEFAQNELFNAQIPIPRLGNRVDCLRSVGMLLCTLNEQDKKLSDVFDENNGNALHVARYISNWIVGFKDEFLKRAQLYVAMVAGRFQDRQDNPIDFHSLSSLTVIADYRVPQTMIGWGMLEISDNFREHLNAMREISEEMIWGRGMRAFSILACDRFVKAINDIRIQNGDTLPQITAIQADPVIWAIPRKYQKAIAQGDTQAIKKFEGIFIKDKEVKFPQVPTILF